MNEKTALLQYEIEALHAGIALEKRCLKVAELAEAALAADLRQIRLGHLRNQDVAAVLRENDELRAALTEAVELLEAREARLRMVGEDLKQAFAGGLPRLSRILRMDAEKRKLAEDGADSGTAVPSEVFG